MAGSAIASSVLDVPGLALGAYVEVLGRLQHLAICVEAERWARLQGNLDQAAVEYQRQSRTWVYLRDPDGARL